MSTTPKVVVTENLRDLGAGKRRRWQVRWKVDSAPEKTRAFETKVAARAFRSRLRTAVANGELFDRSTREPVSWNATPNGPTTAEYTRTWIANKWAGWKPRTRRSEIEEAAAWLPALTTREVADRKSLYEMLTVVLNPTKTPTRAQEDLWRRLVKVSRPIGGVKREHMDAAVTACRTKLDGTRASATYGSRRRANLAQVLVDAVANGVLDRNPLENYREPKAARATSKVDGAEVGEVAQVQAVLRVLKEGASRYLVLYALMFYAGLRPSEAVVVRWGDFTLLPDEGWGELRLRASASEAGRAYTDTGEVRQESGLKAREEGESRPVPLPPVLVAMLLALRPAKARRDSLVCSGRSGKPVSGSTLDTTWKKARAEALPDASLRCLYRCYSLRHSAASLWLGAGAPPAVVAERLGHSVEMLLSTYADVLDSHRKLANARIETAIGRKGKKSRKKVNGYKKKGKKKSR